jgi:HPt (histidine-containing phosphotransfer) domain-containing protein
MEGDREKCLSAGMNDYLSKPFTVDQIRSMIERWLPKSTDVSKEQQASSTSASKPVSMKNSHPNPIDQKALDTIRSLQKEGEPSVLDKIINIYLTSSSNLLQDIREAVKHSDAPSMQKAAHSLKSSSANVGAMTLSVFCKELEMMGRNNSTENAAKILSEIESEYERVHAALTEELQMSTRC